MALCRPLLLLLLVAPPALGGDPLEPAPPGVEPLLHGPSRDPCAGDELKPLWKRRCAEETRDLAHALQLRFDYGEPGYSVGAGYLLLSRQSTGYRGLGVTGWAGLGADARLFGQAPEGTTRGMGFFADARAAMLGDAGGFGAEASLGGAWLGGGARALGSLGVFWSVLYLELGYSYQFPVDGGTREGLIASHQFALRVTAPLASFARSASVGPLVPSPPDSSGSPEAATR